MKTYTIIAGVNGAGKSSLTGVLRQEMNDLGVIVDVDKLAAANGGNNILAGRLAIERIRSCLKKGVCFTQETAALQAVSSRWLLSCPIVTKRPFSIMITALLLLPSTATA